MREDPDWGAAALVLGLAILLLVFIASVVLAVVRVG
jgi:hypothetical protein